MEYWICADGQDETSFAYLIAKELFRYDVRAIINGFDDFENLSKSNFNSNPPKKDSPQIIQIAKQAEKVGSDFFLSTDLSQAPKLSYIGKIYSAMPHNSADYVGCYLNDLIKDYTFEETNERSDNHSLGILLTESDASFIDKLVREVKMCQYLGLILPIELRKGNRVADKSIRFLSKLDLLKNASMVIVDNDYDSLKAAILNCPQILLKPRTSLKNLFKKEDVNILNRLLKSNHFKKYSSRSIDLMLKDVQSLLKDHESYAFVLSHYQEVREILGAESTARNIAKDIISSLEGED